MSFALYGVAHQRPGGYLHVWALGEKGLGDESDKLVTIDADPKSKTYGKVVSSVSVAAVARRITLGFTDDRKYLWAGRLDDSKIFIFDVGTDPAHPKLINTVTDLHRKDRLRRPAYILCYSRPHGDRHFVERQEPRRVTGLAVYNNKGEFSRRIRSQRTMAATAMATTSPSIRRRMCFLNRASRLEQLHDGSRQAHQGCRGR